MAAVPTQNQGSTTWSIVFAPSPCALIKSSEGTARSLNSTGDESLPRRPMPSNERVTLIPPFPVRAK